MKISALLYPLILASASPRRKGILEDLGLQFEVIHSSVKENHLPNQMPEEVAKHLSRLKAQRVAKNLHRGTVIGCDTVVSVEARTIGKPSSPEEAKSILSFLSGKTQRVISGLCMIHIESNIEICGYDVTKVYTKPMTQREIDEYVATGEGLDKAGAYAIQETGDRFIERVEGSFDNVVGFPTELFKDFVSELSKRLEDGGY
jgi:septum formation protein